MSVSTASSVHAAYTENIVVGRCPCSLATKSGLRPIIKFQPIGALLRVPAQAIHRRIIAGLHRAGFRDLRLPHMAVLQYPGPDRSRPSKLAERAGMSKQAMNQLLQSLERLGYLSRRDVKADQRARLVHFTARGRAAWVKAHEILVEIEAEWRTTLGEKDFTRLKGLLCKVWVSDLVP